MNEQAKEIVIAEERPGGLSTVMLDVETIGKLQQFAEMMATAQIAVPEHLRGKPGDCLAICMKAHQFQMDPYTLADKTHVVNGKLGYESQLVQALAKASGAIKGTFRYEHRGEGEQLETRAGAIPAGEHERVWNEWLPISQVSVRNSPLWKSNPKQQMQYLQLKNWVRAYAPEALMGIYSKEELEQGEQEMRDITPGPTTGSSSLNDTLMAQAAANAKPDTEASKGETIEGEAETVVEESETAENPGDTPDDDWGGDGKAPQMAAEELQDVLDEIANAKDGDELQDCINTCKVYDQTGRISDDQKQHLFAAIKKRKAELKAVADNDPVNQ